MSTADMFERIEINPRRCGGSPVVRGTRIPVGVLLDQLAAGDSWDTILKGYPALTPDDIRAVILFAKASVERTEIVPAAADY
jgi:uncharacterized protein (DUF433 family)